MGSKALNALLKDEGNVVTVLVLPTEKDKKLIEPYAGNERVHVKLGDLVNPADVEACVKGTDVVLHLGALISPDGDYFPEKEMHINYGGTLNVISAIKKQPNRDSIKLVWVGTVAQTGDRMPPIHWGRVGDPIAPSVHDYYAVSKVASERAVVESGLKYWVCLRQTGIIAPKMTTVEDGIMFHNCLDNVLEYVSDNDSGVLLGNICKDLPEEFWNHIYNIGGGESCRTSCYQMFEHMFGLLGIKKLEYIIDANWFATRNFHGQYYLDSQKLEDLLHFRSQNLDYFYKLFIESLGANATVVKGMTKMPGGQKLIGSKMKERFEKIANSEHGTMNYIKNNITERIDPFFISKEEWSKIPPSINDFKPFTDWDKVVPIDHGYDESKPQSALTIEDVKGAATFRGGECLADTMTTGDMATKLSWKCAFGHTFEASPKLILEGGHWCSECEDQSWNYHEVAKVSPFFAQVWYPLHRKDEPSREYKKLFSARDVEAKLTESLLV